MSIIGATNDVEMGHVRLLAESLGTPKSFWRVAVGTWRVRVGGLMAMTVLAIAIFGPLLTSQRATEFVAAPLSAPGGDAGLLGTDILGRDVATRLLEGGRAIVGAAFLAATIGVSLGAAVGLVVGLSRSEWAMRMLDILLAFPEIILVLVLTSVLGVSWPLLISIVAIAHVPRVARVMRAVAAEVASRDFVVYSRSLGESRRTVLVREVLPNVSGPLLVEYGLRLAYSINVIAALGFLGFGTQPPTPDWGLMISENQIGLTVQPWAVMAPVVAIAVLTVGSNLLVDGVARIVSGVDGRDEA